MPEGFIQVKTKIPEKQKNEKKKETNKETLTMVFFNIKGGDRFWTLYRVKL